MYCIVYDMFDTIPDVIPVCKRARSQFLKYSESAEAGLF